MHKTNDDTLLCVAAIGFVTLLALLSTAAVVPSPISSTNEEVATEALRLSGIAQDRNLMEADFETLIMLAEPHPVLAHETEEAVWMVNHNMHHHVNHALSAIMSIAATGKYVCPADSLSHIRPYLDFNEYEKAEHVLNEGKDSLPAWNEKVFLAQQKNPSAYPGADVLIAEMNATIQAFEAGNMAEARTHSAYLEQNGYC